MGCGYYPSGWSSPFATLSGLVDAEADRGRASWVSNCMPKWAAFLRAGPISLPRPLHGRSPSGMPEVQRETGQDRKLQNVAAHLSATPFVRNDFCKRGSDCLALERAATTEDDADSSRSTYCCK